MISTVSEYLGTLVAYLWCVSPPYHFRLGTDVSRFLFGRLENAFSGTEGSKDTVVSVDRVGAIQHHLLTGFSFFGPLGFAAVATESYGLLGSRIIDECTAGRS